MAFVLCKEFLTRPITFGGEIFNFEKTLKTAFACILPPSTMIKSGNLFTCFAKYHSKI